MFLYGIGLKGLFMQYLKNARLSASIIDGTVIQVGNQKYWLWICIEPINNYVFGIYISK